MNSWPDKSSEEASPSPSSMASYIGGIPQMCFRDVSHQKKEEPSLTKYTLVIADTTPALVHLLPKLIDTTSTGSRHTRMQRKLSRSVMGVSAMQSKITCRLKSSG